MESTNSILVPLETINKNGYNLSFRRYKPVEYEKVEYEDPEVLINKILQLEEEIAENLQELKAMTNEEG